MGFHLEYKTFYARKTQNEATNKQSDHRESPNLATNNSFLNSLYVVILHNNFKCIKSVMLMNFIYQIFNLV